MENENEIENKDVSESKNEKEITIGSKLKLIFIQRYKDKTGLKYSWSAKDATATKNLANQIRSSITDKNGECSDQNILETWEFMLGHLPEWYEKNGFEPAVINSKYNSIIQQIKSKNGSDDDFDKQIEESLRRMGRA